LDAGFGLVVKKESKVPRQFPVASDQLPVSKAKAFTTEDAEDTKKGKIKRPGDLVVETADPLTLRV